LRLIVVFPSNPTTCLPHGEVLKPRTSVSSVTEWLTPRIERSPCTLNFSPPAGTIEVLLEVRCGWFSTSKKSADRRWPSRCSFRVSMLATSIVTSTWLFAGCSRSRTNVPSTVLKRPRTVLTIKCRTANSTLVWLPSIFQVLGPLIATLL